MGMGHRGDVDECTWEPNAQHFTAFTATGNRIRSMGFVAFFTFYSLCAFEVPLALSKLVQYHQIPSAARTFLRLFTGCVACVSAVAIERSRGKGQPSFTLASLKPSAMQHLVWTIVFLLAAVPCVIALTVSNIVVVINRRCRRALRINAEMCGCASNLRLNLILGFLLFIFVSALLMIFGLLQAFQVVWMNYILFAAPWIQTLSLIVFRLTCFIMRVMLEHLGRYIDGLIPHRRDRMALEFVGSIGAHMFAEVWFLNIILAVKEAQSVFISLFLTIFARLAFCFIQLHPCYTGICLSIKLFFSERKNYTNPTEFLDFMGAISESLLRVGLMLKWGTSTSSQSLAERSFDDVSVSRTSGIHSVAHLFERRFPGLLRIRRQRVVFC